MYDREFEPLPGDSGLLATKSADYLRMADAIRRATASLRVVADTSEMQSSAVAAVRENATKVADSIAQAEDRYRETAEALSAYSGSLRDAQSDAQTAIASIGSAETEYRTAQSRADTAEETATEATPEQAANQQAARGLATDAAEKFQGIAAAESAWRAASAAKDSAARTAAEAIHSVVKDSGLNDSWWDNWGSDMLKIFRAICDIAGILAIFLSWVPILGQVLLVLAAVGALINIIEAAINVATGEGSWTDLIVAVALGVVSCFGGKILGQFSKMARAKGVVKANALSHTTGVSRTALQGRPPAGQYMNLASARVVTRNPLPFRSNFTDPFGVAAAGKGWPGSVPNVLKGGLGISDDVAPIMRMGAAGHQPIATGTKVVVGTGQVIVTGEIVYSNVVSPVEKVVAGR